MPAIPRFRERGGTGQIDPGDDVEIRRDVAGVARANLVVVLVMGWTHGMGGSGWEYSDMERQSVDGWQALSTSFVKLGRIVLDAQGIPTYAYAKQGNQHARERPKKLQSRATFQTSPHVYVGTWHSKSIGFALSKAAGTTALSAHIAARGAGLAHRLTCITLTAQAIDAAAQFVNDGASQDDDSSHDRWKMPR